MTTSTVLRGLEQRGLVGRIRDTQDARIRRVLLTIAGNTLVTQAVDVAEQADKAFWRPGFQDHMFELLEALASFDG